MAPTTIDRTALTRGDFPRRLPHAKVATRLFDSSNEVACSVADAIAELIQDNTAAGLPTVLGLPTGSTPIGVYRELIRRHQQEGLDFSSVITFNLDEYWPMDPQSLQSYRRWMHETFFNHVNILPENIHIPRGDLSREDVEDFCREYEQTIEQYGGIQLMLLGIGRTGHIGFNEPGSSRNSRTRMITLDPLTRRDAASDFFGESNVPQHAITMGVGTILSAKRVIVMALGEHKADIVRRAVEGDVTEDVAASFLQTHSNAVFAVDAAAASRLTAVATPWLVGHVEWTDALEKRAVCWLSDQTGKALLKLEERDFLEHHLHELTRQRGPTDAIRQRVFQSLLSGICEGPAGETPQRVLVFSPHPDDDVISMGGTLVTLAEQQHEVHIAYMTTGNIAVFDHDALRHVDYIREFLDLFELGSEDSRRLLDKLADDVAAKQPGDVDSRELLVVKTLIRKTEATAAAKTAGVPEGNLHFLDLPFYRTGEVAKRPIGEDDIHGVVELIRRLKPAQIFMAGDLSDPHGTHRLCAQAIIRALETLKADRITPEVWLYRGAWQEYEPHEIEMAVPLSPETMLRKKLAIFKHESQKDRALFPGHDEREFWVRAEHRTKRTAELYNGLGLPEYHALEGFVRLADRL